MDSIQDIFTPSASFSADQDESAVKEGVRQVSAYNLSTEKARFVDYCSSFRAMNLNDTRDGTPPLSDESFSSNATSLLATPLIDFDARVRDLEHITQADPSPALTPNGSEIDDAETQALLFSAIARQEPVPVTTFPVDIEFTAWLPIDDEDFMCDAAPFIVDIVNFDAVSDDQVYADGKVPPADLHFYDSLLTGFDTSRAGIMQDALPIVDHDLSARTMSNATTAAYKDLAAFADEFTIFVD